MANGRGRFTWVLIAMLLLASGAACASSVFVFVLPLFGSDPNAQPVLVTPRGDLSQSERTTVELFRSASPSVVYITSIAVRVDRWSRNYEEIPEGTGSGFMWDERGHIVTNFHVIANAQAARVTLADQSSWPAELVGAVAEKDLAVLRIRAPREVLRPLPVGTSSDLAVGQSVFAIGNPFGLDHTLSTGVVSGLEREIMGVGGRPILGMVQTDAAINPGNSGGPLLDSAGRLIGVNTAIHSPSGASAGIGFAIPVDTVRSVVPQLIEHGRVIRPALGVHIADPRMVQGLRARGALIMRVDPGSPAARVGLQPTRRDQYGRIYLGDLIVGIDETAVSEPNDIYRVLDRHAVGDRVRVALDRNGEMTEVEIELVGVAAE
jgi:S1-C subfamily serine protease